MSSLDSRTQSKNISASLILLRATCLSPFRANTVAALYQIPGADDDEPFLYFTSTLCAHT